MNASRDDVQRFVGRKHRLLVADPHPQSLAASVLLKADLSCQLVAEWLTFRTAWLTRQKERHGDLVCHYCRMGGLQMDLPADATKADLRHLATVDHVNPRANGGAEYDEANLVVACHPCNNRKGDSTHLAHTGP